MTDETNKPKGVADTEHVGFRAEAPSKGGRTLKVRRIGNSLGVVLPKEVLAQLRVGEGDVLSVSDTPDGVLVTAFNDRLQEQMEAGRHAMKRYRNALRELAK